MAALRVSSITGQVAGHLRDRLRHGHWRGLMPGRDRLAEELGVSRKTVERALELLEGEGLLVSQGVGRRRLIDVPAVSESGARRSLRIAILASEPVDLKLEYVVGLRHHLAEAGHVPFHPPKAMRELKMNVSRIARLAGKTEADAWVVLSGSHEVLEWFAARTPPAFALFGRRRGLPIAATGPDKPPALVAAVRALTAFGHRRIVLLARPRRRLPRPGASEQGFLDELAAQGIPSGPYNLPDWEESIDSYHSRLESLFQLVPPTALIIDEAPLFAAAQQFLARRNLKVPEDVSLVCTDADPTFEWCQPSIAHIRWDSRPVVRRIERWAANVSRGKKDIRQSLTPAEFVNGGTIGPVNES